MSKAIDESVIISELRKNDLLNAIAKKIYKRMKELHDKGCTSNCFTELDVLIKLAQDLNIIPFTPARYEGSNVEWYGIWGNLAFSHFLHYYYVVTTEIIQGNF
jgi:hypothetical protein